MIAATLLAISAVEHQTLSQNLLKDLGAFLLILALLGVIILLWRKAPGWWNAHMKRRHAKYVAAQGESIREKALKTEVETILLKGLQASVDAQRISEKERNKTLNWLNYRLGLPGLVAKPRDPQEVKQKLKGEKAAREAKERDFNKKVHGFRAGNKAS